MELETEDKAAGDPGVDANQHRPSDPPWASLAHVPTPPDIVKRFSGSIATAAVRKMLRAMKPTQRIAYQRSYRNFRIQHKRPPLIPKTAVLFTTDMSPWLQGIRKKSDSMFHVKKILTPDVPAFDKTKHEFARQVVMSSAIAPADVSQHFDWCAKFMGVETSVLLLFLVNILTATTPIDDRYRYSMFRTLHEAISDLGISHYRSTDNIYHVIYIKICRRHMTCSQLGPPNSPAA